MPKATKLPASTLQSSLKTRCSTAIRLFGKLWESLQKTVAPLLASPGTVIVTVSEPLTAADREQLHQIVPLLLQGWTLQLVTRPPSPIIIA